MRISRNFALPLVNRKVRREIHFERQSWRAVMLHPGDSRTIFSRLLQQEKQALEAFDRSIDSILRPWSQPPAKPLEAPSQAMAKRSGSPLR